LFESIVWLSLLRQLRLRLRPRLNLLRLLLEVFSSWWRLWLRWLKLLFRLLSLVLLHWKVCSLLLYLVLYYLGLLLGETLLGKVKRLIVCRSVVWKFEKLCGIPSSTTSRKPKVIGSPVDIVLSLD